MWKIKRSCNTSYVANELFVAFAVPVEPTSLQSLQSMKAFRYVAGLSTEEIIRADDEGDT